MSENYPVFDLFKKQCAIVTAGTTKNFDGCTVGWGSLGTIWNKDTVTVYVHPARYTSEFLLNNDTFTVSFFPEDKKNAVMYMGSHSGRNEDKAINAGLTPMEMHGSVGFQEASLTFVCRKLYQHQFTKEDLASEIQKYYENGKKIYPDGNGGWQPHYVFVGEVIDKIE